MSSSKTIYNYRYYYIPSALYKTEWSETTPTSSNIDQDSITIIDQISSDVIRIQNDKGSTNGNYMLDGFTVDIPAMQSNVSVIKTYPYAISCYSIYCCPTVANINDTFSCYSSALPIIPVMSNISIGSSNIQIPNPFIQFVNNGFKVSLSNSASSESLGRIINMSNNILTTEYAASNVYNTSDQISIKAYFVNNILMPSTEKIVIGQGTLNGTYIPKNTPVALEYQNNDGASKKMTFHIELMY